MFVAMALITKKTSENGFKDSRKEKQEAMLLFTKNYQNLFCLFRSPRQKQRFLLGSKEEVWLVLVRQTEKN